MITISKVEEAIKMLKSRKTPGTNLMPNELYNLGPTLLAPAIAELFILPYRSGRIPFKRESSYMSYIQKQGRASGFY